jgi:2-polyprenyl-3-methyl-5-hydroxy-6-metoxy-1,4-benzoquinol methylase
MMSKDKLDTRTYWEQRLATETNLKGTGHRAFDMDNNLWLYRTQRECLDQVLNEHHVMIPGKSVLDIGSGTGFFVDFYQERQAGSIVGVDLTVTSKNYLEAHYPAGTYYAADISEEALPFSGEFDIVSAMGVLYHIVDENRFQQAIINICSLLKSGGYLVISDSFQKPFLPTAQHAHLRSLMDYEPILKQQGVSILDLRPVYYLSNRTYIPVIGPALINGLKLGKTLYTIDQRLRQTKLSNGTGLKTLLARKSD